MWKLFKQLGLHAKALKVVVKHHEEKQNKEGDGRQCNHRHPREDEVSKSWWMSEPGDVMDQCKGSRQLN